MFVGATVTAGGNSGELKYIDVMGRERRYTAQSSPSEYYVIIVDATKYKAAHNDGKDIANGVWIGDSKRLYATSQRLGVRYVEKHHSLTMLSTDPMLHLLKQGLTK